MIGGFIKDAREKKHFSKVDLSRELDLLGVPITPPEIYRMETNRMIIKDFELVALCVALDVNLNDLKKFLE